MAAWRKVDLYGYKDWVKTRLSPGTHPAFFDGLPVVMKKTRNNHSFEMRIPMRAAC